LAQYYNFVRTEHGDVLPGGGNDGAGEGTEVAHAHEDEELTEGARHTKGGNLRQGSQLFIFSPIFLIISQRFPQIR
jgi:hypothetical protein